MRARLAALLLPIALGGCTARRAPAVERAGARGFPNPVLVAHDGARVRFYDDVVKDRCVLVHFAYTRCTGSCPRTTANLLAVQRILRDRGWAVPLVTVSLDAEQDTPAAARRYVELHGAPPGWRYLTGERADLEALRAFLGFTDRRPEVDADRSQHLRMVLVGNAPADRWVGLPALSRPELIADAAIRTATEGSPAACRARSVVPGNAGSTTGSAGSSHQE